MRSAFIAAAFAAGVLAVPNKRDLATTVQLDIVTAFVTVTAGTPAATSAALFNANNRVLASAPASAPAAATSAAAVVVDQTQDASGDVQGEVEQTTDDSQQQSPSSDDSQSQDQSQGQDQSSNAAPQTAGQGSSSNSGSDAASTAVDAYSAEVVHHHALHRSNHSSAALEWDGGLAGIASDIAHTCVYGHNTEMGGGGYGQNIAAGVSPDGIGRIITEMFYNNEVNYYNGLYDIPDPSDDNFEAWGHFSQIVWDATKKVGCATVDCSSSGVGWFTVCNYSPPGNWAGQYGQNIHKPNGDATAYGDS